MPENISRTTELLSRIVVLVLVLVLGGDRLAFWVHILLCLPVAAPPPSLKPCATGQAAPAAKKNRRDAFIVVSASTKDFFIIRIFE
jgi:hypothetical protein